MATATREVPYGTIQLSHGTVQLSTSHLWSEEGRLVLEGGWDDAGRALLGIQRSRGFCVYSAALRPYLQKRTSLQSSALNGGATLDTLPGSGSPLQSAGISPARVLLATLRVRNGVNLLGQTCLR